MKMNKQKWSAAGRQTVWLHNLYGFMKRHWPKAGEHLPNPGDHPEREHLCSGPGCRWKKNTRKGVFVSFYMSAFVCTMCKERPWLAVKWKVGWMMSHVKQNLGCRSLFEIHIIPYVEVLFLVLPLMKQRPSVWVYVWGAYLPNCFP